MDQDAPINEGGSLTPPMLSLESDAKAAWVEFHDAIEGELSTGGELYDVRDVASKSADNAVRLWRLVLARLLPNRYRKRRSASRPRPRHPNLSGWWLRSMPTIPKPTRPRHSPML